MRGHPVNAVMRSEQGRDRRCKRCREATSDRSYPGPDVLWQPASQVGEGLQSALLVVRRHGGGGQEREDRFPVRLLRMPGIKYDERAANIRAAQPIASGMCLADLLGYLLRQ